MTQMTTIQESTTNDNNNSTMRMTTNGSSSSFDDKQQQLNDRQRRKCDKSKQLNNANDDNNNSTIDKDGNATMANASTVETMTNDSNSTMGTTTDEDGRQQLHSLQGRNAGNSMYTSPVICGGWPRSVGNLPQIVPIGSVFPP